MSDRLSICMVTTFYPPHNFGGDGIHVQRLSSALARRGHRIDVVYPPDAHRLVADGSPARRRSGSCRQGAGASNGDPGADGGAQAGDDPAVGVHPLRSPLGRLAPILSHQLGLPVAGRRRLAKILEEGAGSTGPPDVIHYHNVSLVGGPKVLTWGAGVKLYTAHEYWLGCPTHMLYRYNREPCTNRTCIRCTLSYGRPPQWWRYTSLTERSVSRLDALIAPSELTASKYRELGLDVRVRTLPHFLPDAYRRRAEAAGRRAPDLEPYCLYVGRLDRVKGLHTVLPAFARGEARMPLRVAGNGPEGKALREMAGDGPHVEFLGRVEGRRLHDLYRDAVAIVLPSAGFETFGQVVLEAFAHETPAFVSPVGGARELVRSSGAGAVYRDPADLCRRLRRLAEDPARREELGDAGTRYLDSAHDERGYVRRYEELVAELRRS